MRYGARPHRKTLLPPARTLQTNGYFMAGPRSIACPHHQRGSGLAGATYGASRNRTEQPPGDNTNSHRNQTVGRPRALDQKNGTTPQFEPSRMDTLQPQHYTRIWERATRRGTETDPDPNYWNVTPPPASGPQGYLHPLVVRQTPPTGTPTRPEAPLPRAPTGRDGIPDRGL